MLMSRANMTQHKHKDKIYAEPRSPVAPFRFDERVAAVFPDMIARSVPGYAAIIEGIAVIAAEYALPHSRCYDLGCSLGAAALALRAGVGERDCEIIAVDNSAAMLAKAARLMKQNQHGGAPVTLVESDIMDVALSEASVVVLNFTLQFIPREFRPDLLRRIAGNMLPGGALVLSEKIRFDVPGENATFTQLHHAFKRAQGYSDLEISQKRQALEDVLVPETLDAHVERLKAAGFSQVHLWFQQLNFVSLLALR